MQKNDNPWEKLKKFFTEDNKEDKKKDKNNVVDDLPKELRDKLPSNMKVKRVKIGPGSILRGLVYVILAFWLFSSIRQMFTPNNMVEAPLSTVVETIKNNEAEKVIVMDNEILVELKDGDQVLMASKEPGSSMTEILQREGIDIGSIDYEVENRQGWKTFGDILSLLLTVGLPLLFIVWFFGKVSSGTATTKI